MGRRDMSAIKALNATGAVVARSLTELKEHGLPHESELVAWRGPWRYYKAFPVRASAAHETAEEGEVLHWTVGEFGVRTNHPKAEGRPRSQGWLYLTHGSRSEPPADYDGLYNWIRIELTDAGMLAGILTESRPDLPPFSGVREEGEDE